MKEIVINYKGRVDNRGYGVYLGEKNIENVLKQTLPGGRFYGTVSVKVTIEDEKFKLMVDGVEVKEEEDA